MKIKRLFVRSFFGILFVMIVGFGYIIARKAIWDYKIVVDGVLSLYILYLMRRDFSGPPELDADADVSFAEALFESPKDIRFYFFILFYVLIFYWVITEIFALIAYIIRAFI